MSPGSRTILLADQPDGVALVRRALAAPYETVEVHGLEEAKRRLHPGISLVICGCHFDEGRMYDLLRHMKATPALAGVRFMAARCLKGELEDTLYESVKIAVRALGGNGFVDLLRWQTRHGEAEASHRLTRLVQSLIDDAGPDSG